MANWLFLPVGYCLTVAIETPILLLGLSPRHRWKRRLFAGFWLTACTYPVVVIVLPALFGPDHRGQYLIVAETFAPAAECALFWLAFGERAERWKKSMWWDLAAIVLANLASFAVGEALGQAGTFDFLIK